MLITLGLAMFTLLAVVIGVFAFISQVFTNPNLVGFLAVVIGALLQAGLFVYVKLSPILPIIVHERAGPRILPPLVRADPRLFLAHFRSCSSSTSFLIFLISFVIAALIGFVSIFLINEIPTAALFAFQAIRIASQAIIRCLFLPDPRRAQHLDLPSPENP